ncbi:MAG: cytochrome c-type biogenesis protein CcmH [Myxococcales bacterium]|jgi:cytochrome c-type biogenesis protein CcmH/NrfF
MAPRALIVLCLLLPGVAVAQTGDGAPTAEQASRQAQGVARSIMSPFCPGKTVDACPSPRAGQWRREIRQWVEQGDSPEQIRARLQARVPGFDLSGRPGARWDWALPLGAMTLATLGLWLFVRRLRPRDRMRPPRSPSRDPESDTPERDRDDLDARIDAELARTEG